MINERIFADLIFPHTIDDLNTFCKLSQVSKRFHEVSKKYLIKKENFCNGSKKVWTELPNGKKHGLFRGWYSNGQLWHELPYQQGQPHGLCRGWYLAFSQSSEARGQLAFKTNYNQGQLIENEN
jgi:antitoxin component YwqK of YwqJK toxin-antitoxin module